MKIIPRGDFEVPPERAPANEMSHARPSAPAGKRIYVDPSPASVSEADPSVPKSVIISLRDPASGFASDAELPTGMPAGDLSRGLAALLRSLEPKYFAGTDKLSLSFNSITLSGHETLASVHAWDGSEILIRR